MVDQNRANQEKNRLAAESSPYLLQHQFNPVDWYPWGDEAFAAARRENKPIFLSIGYSSCYWCHVMEKDSFEMDDVAEVLNQHFISIKVDREERPDIDQIYMEAVVRLTGRGGWPMSVFLTPDLRPFWGGTFFYRAQFLTILERIHDIWQREPESIAAASAELSSALQDKALQGVSQFDRRAHLLGALMQFENNFDRRHGGFGGAPKFPPAVQISLLLRIYFSEKRDAALHMAERTLECMARGGIFDQLGGGFHRYSTDSEWIVPHFEKMLYDNALLASSYMEAFELTRKVHYAHVAKLTLNYLLREMYDTAGGFYAAQDAGEVEKEGEYYVWQERELKELLSESEYVALTRVYQFTPGGNFEHSHILRMKDNVSWTERETADFISAQDKMIAIREKRTKPFLDRKIITGWNGLALSAFAKAYRVLGDKSYLDAAEGIARFIREKLYDGTRLLRSYSAGEAKISAFAEDYAYLIEGLISLYEASFEEKWLEWADRLQSEQNEFFWDSENAGYYFSDSPQLILRKKEWIDGATPASNATSLLNLMRLCEFYIRPAYMEKIDSLSSVFAGLTEQSPTAFAKAVIAFHRAQYGAKQVVILEPEKSVEGDQFLAQINQGFFPLVALARRSHGVTGSAPDIFSDRELIDGRATFFVCKEHVCELPTNDAEKAMQLIAK